jgi:TIR domain-containing protein
MPRPSKPYIFISHSSKDSEFSRFLAGHLQQAGFHPWVDVVDIPEGSTWPRLIQEAVEGCGALVVVMSRNGRESEWVEREALLALSLHKPLFVALVDEVKLPIYLINRQFTDFRKRPEQGAAKLIAALRKTPLDEVRVPEVEAKLSSKPNEHNFFKYMEQLPDGTASARIARKLFAWAAKEADAITFSGKASPAFHAHIWVGPGGVAVFSVRAYARQPSVEIPFQYMSTFPPLDSRQQRLALLEAFNRLMPAEEQFSTDKADLRPNLPLSRALGTADALMEFQKTVGKMITLLRSG